MIGTLLEKLLAPLLICSVGFAGGIAFQQKVLNEPAMTQQCPACNCPEAVSIQPFEVEKMKNLRNFTYTPQFTGTVSVAGVDSATVRKYIDESVMKAFERHVIKIDEKKRKR
jgi:hypothetical protein